MKAQGIDRTKFVYYSRLQPWLAIWGVVGTFCLNDFLFCLIVLLCDQFWLTILILINGFDGFWAFTASVRRMRLFRRLMLIALAFQGFLTSYINVPLVIALYIGWKVVKKTKM